VDKAVEAKFRSLARVVNLDTEQYNYLVPLARFQRGKKSEEMIVNALKAARGGGGKEQ